MKKHFSLTKITAFLTALVMMISATSVFAFAAETTDMPTSADEHIGVITVNGVEDEATVNAYKIIDVAYNYTAQQPLDPEFYWVNNESLLAYLKGLQGNFAGLVNDDRSVNTTVINTIKEDTELSKQFYDGLAAAIRNGTVNLDAAETRTGSGNLENLEMGNYLILIENSEKVYQASAVNVAPKYNTDTKKWELENPTVTLKATETNLNKQIVLADGAKVSATNANIGDVISYEVTGKLPVYPELSLNSQYVIGDKMPNGLTFKEITGVYGVDENGQEYPLTENTDYTVTTTGAKRASDNTTTVDFAVSFNYATVHANAHNYTDVRIKYTATLNTTAVLGKDGNVNTAFLDYTNDPYEKDPSWKSYEKTATVYTFGFDLTKVDKKDENKTLAGAEFTLYTDEDLKNAVTFTGTDGSYTKYDTLQADAQTTTVKVDENGKLVLKGLAAGTYYLKETKAPESYNIASKAFTLVVTNDDNDGIAQNAAGDKFADGLVTMNIPNSNGFSLPTTGGMGTVLFTVAGIALVALGVVMIVVLKKKSKKAAE